MRGLVSQGGFSIIVGFIALESLSALCTKDTDGIFGTAIWANYFLTVISIARFFYILRNVS